MHRAGTNNAKAAKYIQKLFLYETCSVGIPVVEMQVTVAVQAGAGVAKAGLAAPWCGERRGAIRLLSEVSRAWVMV